MSQLNVYVKHYLNPEGLDYFKKEWFPQVLAFMSQQEGYLDCTYQISEDCVDITIQFKDEPSFDAYVNVPEHHKLAKMLDRYRSRTYWKAVRTKDLQKDPDSLEWDNIDPVSY